MGQLRLGRYRNSLSLARKFQEVARKVDDVTAMLTGGRIEGVALLHLADYHQALKVFHFVLEHMTPDIRRIFMVRFGFDPFIGVRTCMAQIAWFQGFPDQARRIAQELVDLAGSQGARSWQLRAATSLAKIWYGEGRISEARELLLPICDWFTEGFATQDFTAAKALVAKL